MKVTMLLRWSAKEIDGTIAGSTEYLVTGELGEAGSGQHWAHCVVMTPEMVEDDWLPDVCARIERLARSAHPPPPIYVISDEEVERFRKLGLDRVPGGFILWGDKPVSEELAAALTRASSGET